MKGYSTTFVLFIVFLLSFSMVQGQQITMQNGFFEQCEGELLDSGAEGASYQNNENYTLTICPDVPGDVVGVDFFLFDLSPTNTMPSPQNNQDRLIVFDGDNASAPSLGTFVGTELQDVFISASTLNVSGCLTFRFISNNSGVGNFAGTIICETPCDRPTAVGSDDGPANRKICVGDVVNFDGSESYPGAGFVITEYLWDFGDGTTADTPIASHSWDVPGEYIVELYLIDNNGCASTNRITLQLLVATLPDWNSFPTSTTICLGESVVWEVDPDEFEMTWIAENLGQYSVVDNHLNDIVGACFEFSLGMAGFAPGQTLTNIYDLFSIDIDIYHTFLFDLLISIECPSGQSITMHQQMQQPNGTNVIANGTDLGLPGSQTCLNYGWTPGGTQTWSQAVGGLSGVLGSLPSGNYMSLQPMTGLVGCDLNGTWTLSVCDLWGGDAGYLCGWGLTINPALIPDITEFTPDIGSGSDSSFWAGPYIVDTSADGNNITVTPTETGVFDYTYTVINDHGCSHDSTITITVTGGLDVVTGPNIVVCDEVGQLETYVNGNLPPSSCIFTIEMFDTFGDGWNGFGVTILQDGVSIGYFTFNSGLQSTATFIVNHGSTIQINTTSGLWNTEVYYYIYNSNGEIFFQDAGTNFSGTPILLGNNIFTGTAVCQPGELEYVFQWFPESGLSDPTISNPTVMVNQTTTYTVTVGIPDQPFCTGFGEVVVSVPLEVDPGLDTELTICSDTPDFNMTNALNGNPVNNGVWTDSLSIVSEIFSPMDYPEGGTFVYTYTTMLDSCVKFSQLTINVTVGIDFEVGIDPQISLVLDTLYTDFQANWTYQWFLNGIEIDGANSNSYVAIQNGVYTVLITDELGCTALLDPYIYLSTSLLENGVSPTWNAFPIPFSNELRINGSQAIDEITIWSVDGRVVYSMINAGQQTNNMEINTSGWSSGLYMVQVSGKSGTEVLKVVCR